MKRRNVIFERPKFNNRRQEPGETVDTGLYGLAEHCGYGPLHDEMIRDRIVVGILDAKMSEKMQLDPDLTLEKAVTQTRQSETAKQQQPTIRGADQETPIDAVNDTKKPFKPRHQYSGAKQPSKPTFCTRCGRSSYHEFQQCPARNVLCHRCNRRGHFQAHCKTSQTPGKVLTSEPDDFFLGTVTSNHANSAQSWSTTVQLNNTPV